MMRIILDLRCSHCGHEEFYVPTSRDNDDRVTCTHCNAFQCDTDDLEIALLDAQREKARTRAA